MVVVLNFMDLLFRFIAAAIAWKRSQFLFSFLQTCKKPIEQTLFLFSFSSLFLLPMKIIFLQFVTFCLATVFVLLSAEDYYSAQNTDVDVTHGQIH